MTWSHASFGLAGGEKPRTACGSHTLLAGLMGAIYEIRLLNAEAARGALTGGV